MPEASFCGSKRFFGRIYIGLCPCQVRRSKSRVEAGRQHFVTAFTTPSLGQNIPSAQRLAQCNTRAREHDDVGDDGQAKVRMRNAASSAPFPSRSLNMCIQRSWIGRQADPPDRRRGATRACTEGRRACKTVSHEIRRRRPCQRIFARRRIFSLTRRSGARRRLVRRSALATKSKSGLNAHVQENETGMRADDAGVSHADLWLGRHRQRRRAREHDVLHCASRCAEGMFCPREGSREGAVTKCWRPASTRDLLRRT